MKSKIQTLDLYAPWASMRHFHSAESMNCRTFKTTAGKWIIIHKIKKGAREKIETSVQCCCPNSQIEW